MVFNFVPIVAVPNPAGFALKVAVATLAVNLLAVLVYGRGARQGAAPAKMLPAGN